MALYDLIQEYIKNPSVINEIRNKYYKSEIRELGEIVQEYNSKSRMSRFLYGLLHFRKRRKYEQFITDFKDINEAVGAIKEILERYEITIFDEIKELETQYNSLLSDKKDLTETFYYEKEEVEVYKGLMKFIKDNNIDVYLTFVSDKEIEGLEPYKYVQEFSEGKISMKYWYDLSKVSSILEEHREELADITSELKDLENEIKSIEETKKLKIKKLKNDFTKESVEELINKGEEFIEYLKEMNEKYSRNILPKRFRMIDEFKGFMNAIVGENEYTPYLKDSMALGHVLKDYPRMTLRMKDKVMAYGLGILSGASFLGTLFQFGYNNPKVGLGLFVLYGISFFAGFLEYTKSSKYTESDLFDSYKSIVNNKLNTLRYVSRYLEN